MKIAQVAPLYESVPPKLYGGTERVVSYLTEELVRKGHQVVLFASGDSTTTAELRPVCDRALRLEGRKIVDPLAHHVRMLELVMREAEEFDVLHFHCDYLHFPLSRRLSTPSVTTLHGRLDIPDLRPLYREFSDVPLVSISNSQRAPLHWANWIGTVYHGLPHNMYVPTFKTGSYLAFLGRISPEKRVDRAIEIALRAGMPIRIAAKIDPADQEYFDTKIRRMLDHSLVECVGEIGEKEKSEFLGDAAALLFPVDWPEPFGLVMIEAMACGTPVIAWNLGSVPEVIEEGVTGCIVSSMDEAVRAVERVISLDRARCRNAFDRRFSVRRMCLDYLDIYQKLSGEEPQISRDNEDLIPVAA